MTAVRYLTIGACVLVTIAVVLALVEVASMVSQARATRRSYPAVRWWEAWRHARRGRR